MRRFFLHAVLFFLASPVAAQTPTAAAEAAPALFQSFYRVSCVPALHYLAIIREDYRGEAAAAATPQSHAKALKKYGLYINEAQGECVLAGRRAAWNVAAPDMRVTLTLDGKMLVNAVALLPSPPPTRDTQAAVKPLPRQPITVTPKPLPVLHGFELVAPYQAREAELTLHGQWLRPAMPLPVAMLPLTAARFVTLFQGCDRQREAPSAPLPSTASAMHPEPVARCASYHFLRFALPNKLAKNPKKTPR
jgi:hypothetical protein